MNNQFQKYNLQDSLIVFSSYAKSSGQMRDMNALAWYTKHLLLSFPKNKKIIFLSEKTSTMSNSPFEDQGRILIIPCWEKNNTQSLFDILQTISLFNSPKRFLFQFEFNMFGNIMGPIITLGIVLYLSLLRKRIYFQIHQIVLDVTTIKDQIHVKNPFFLHFFNFSLRIFYRLIFLFSHKVIVTEEALSKRLNSIVNTNKLIILPHHVLNEPIVARSVVRKKTKNLLFFGYLSWYKGIDWLVKTFKILQKHSSQLKLIVAGGESPTQKHKKFYRQYYAALKHRMHTTPNVTHTGFISDKQIKQYMKKADVVILPYRSFISSSGPLSWALAHHKPVIFSTHLKEYMYSSDFADAMKQAEIRPCDLFFDLNAASFNVFLTKINLKKLIHFSTLLAEKRSQKNVVKQLYTILYGEKIPALSYSWLQTITRIRFALNYAQK